MTYTLGFVQHLFITQTQLSSSNWGGSRHDNIAVYIVDFTDL